MRGFLFPTVSLGVLVVAAHAHDIPAQNPVSVCQECSCNTCVSPRTQVGPGAFLSLTEGNLHESVALSSASSSTGPTLAFTARYDSYNADGSHAQLDTTMGYGWTHT